MSPLEFMQRLAANLLRDSAEAGRMPSAEKLPPDAAELHRQAADTSTRCVLRR